MNYKMLENELNKALDKCIKADLKAKKLNGLFGKIK